MNYLLLILIGATMELATETRERIFTAANSLYEQAGGEGNFPTVDAVRKLSKVNMNDASAAMREWRRLKRSTAPPAAMPVPEPIQQASAIAMNALWREAQNLSNESLRSAQAGWDAECAEAATLSKQMADAYEALAAELDAAQTSIAQFRSEAEQKSAVNLDMQRRMDSSISALAAANASTATAEARAAEIERRANELRLELDHAHEETAFARDELSALRLAHASELDDLHAEATRKARHHEAQLDAVAASREQAAIAAAKASEELAALRGKMEAIADQNSVLLQTIKTKSNARASNGKKE